MDPSPSHNTHAFYQRIDLLQLLTNSLVLHQITPYLPVSSLLAVGATSKSFKSLVHSTPNVFRHLDLRDVASAKFDIGAIDHGGEVFRHVQVDENITEDDFYGGPLRGICNILQRRNILRDVQTLILDGLSVTSDLVSDIITQDQQYSVRLLSIREVSNLNERKLQQALLYVLRPSRLANTPKLQGLYIFGPKDSAHILPPRNLQVVDSNTTSSSEGVMHSQGAQIGSQWNQKSVNTLASELEIGNDKWYSASGRVITKHPSVDWVSTMLLCQDVISFDAVVCSGPRHSVDFVEEDENVHAPWYRKRSAHLPTQVATYALGGCAACGQAPEKFAEVGISPLSRFPLLAPPPLHSSTSKAAKLPFSMYDNRLLVRCMDCMRGRFCESCHKWWCEDCYRVPALSCFQPLPEPGGNQSNTIGGHPEQNVKVHMGLCVEQCLVSEMMSGAGSNGMWG